MTKLILAGLAALLSIAPASPFDRPKKEPEVKPVACPEVGEGYVRVAGSSTCIKVSGQIRVEASAIGARR